MISHDAVIEIYVYWYKISIKFLYHNQVLEQGTVVGQVVVNSPPPGECLKRTSIEDPQQEEEEVVKKKMKLAASEVKLAESETRKEGAAAANAAGAAAAAVDVEPGKVDKSVVLAVLKQAKLRQEHSLENR
jgi:hypothetical protein